MHLTWENEAVREVADSGGELEIVYPPSAFSRSPALRGWIKNTARRQTTEDAKAYLQFLYTDAAQETVAKYGYRPVNPAILKKHGGQFPKIDLFPITALAKDWDDAQLKFFADNGIFDIIYKPK